MSASSAISPRSDVMAKRQSVNFPGFAHQNPIPNASRIGNVMMTSVISGVDPGTRNLPPELAKQVTNPFTHVRTAIETAGGTPEDRKSTRLNSSHVEIS